MLAPQITNHLEQALARLAEQYKNKPRIVGLLTSLVNEVQTLENALFSLDAGQQLLNSQGAQLDGMGEIIGLKRNGLPDINYLVLLLGTIAENYSDTTAPELINIVQSVFQAGSVFVKTPDSSQDPNGVLPAKIAFGVGSPQFPDDLYGVILQIIMASLGAGIALDYVIVYGDALLLTEDGKVIDTEDGQALEVEKAWAMDGPQKWVQGFGDLADPEAGGGFAELIYPVFDQNGVLLTESGEFLVTEDDELLELG